MKRFTTLLGALAILLASCCAEDPNLYKDATQPIDKRVESLLSQMTLDEKLGQMDIQVFGQNNNVNNMGKTFEGEISPLIGSYIYTRNDAELLNATQKMVIEKSRLGIPVLFCMDVIHGYRTIFPIPLAQACSWDPQMSYETSRVAAKEAYLAGIKMTFSPMMDVARDPRWGRVAESYGEDPYTNCRFGEAVVKGYQGESIADKYSVASCMKHFAGYAYSQGGRDYFPTEVSDLVLWETVLPSFKACVDAGVTTVMSSFNDFNGVPATASHFLLQDVLRDKWKFDGFVVSDWRSIEQILNHRYAVDTLDAGVKALLAGTDMDMYDAVYERFMPEAMDRGLVSMDDIDKSVRRILKTKFELGLFENPYVEVLPDAERFRTPESLALAEKAAEKSMVLLKNENSILPLSKKITSLAVVGVMADSKYDIMGTWTASGDANETISVLDGLKNEFGSDVKINFVEGASFESNSAKTLSALRSAARKSDAVVVAIGEERKWSGENGSVASLGLPACQEQLVIEAKNSGKPVILLLSSGRPLGLSRIEPLADAIVQMWQPGSCGGNAVAGILSGRVNPSGRLAITFPYVTGQVPMFYNHRQNGRVDWVVPQGRYVDAPHTPMYEFGYGLSYSTFEYGDVKISKDKIAKGESVTASVTVKNTSNIDGEETLLWFVDDAVATTTQPIKKLKFFEKGEIKGGESRTFTFEIDPMRDLSFVDRNGATLLEEGDFYIIVKDKRVKLVLE